MALHFFFENSNNFSCNLTILLTEDASLTLTWVLLQKKTDRGYSPGWLRGYIVQKTEVFCIKSIIFPVTYSYVFSVIFSGEIGGNSIFPQNQQLPHNSSFYVLFFRIWYWYTHTRTMITFNWKLTTFNIDVVVLTLSLSDGTSAGQLLSNFR